jgi:hypothetical protein
MIANSRIGEFGEWPSDGLSACETHPTRYQLTGLMLTSSAFTGTTTDPGNSRRISM